MSSFFMSGTHRLVCVFFSVILGGCVNFSSLPPISKDTSPAAVTVPSPKPGRIDIQPAHIDFRVVDAKAMIGKREYIFDVRQRPDITALGENIYQMDLTLRRDSKHSLRADETITTHFYYDGMELIFFGDKNHNQRLDRKESTARYLISHTRELITKNNKRYLQARNLDVELKSRHISSYQRVNSLDIRLIFSE